MPRYFETLESRQSPEETTPDLIPGSVKKAMALGFAIPITGFLCCVVFDQAINCFVGIVYRESRGRFRDGATIRTSDVIRRSLVHSYWLVETIGGSRYVICDWALEGGSPRFTGALH
jgi:hypothetical protein